MKLRHQSLIIYSGIVLSSLLGCTESSKTSESLIKDNQIVVEADTYVNTNGEVIKVKNSDDNELIGGKENIWLEYHIDVPMAGRYQVEIWAKNQSEAGGKNLWVEDYIDNIDDRTYNITGHIEVEQGSDHITAYTRDGSPLNKGLHKIKLHLDAGIVVDKLVFSLMKPHMETPLTLNQEMGGSTWAVAWSDEFDGSELDTSKWTYDIGNWGWGNGEHQYYTENRKENVRIEDGNLIIEAHKGDLGYPWTSARLTTRGKVSFVHGKIEFRAKVPKNKGNWAAGWTLGDSYVDELSWPYCGEIDILESVGFEMDDETGNGIAHASAHCRAYYFKIGNQPTGIVEVEKMDREYHDYAVEWTADYIKAYVDGQLYFTYEDNTTEQSWPFNEPQNIILNLAMGGGWGGAQGMDETITTQKMIVDYVRVYERK